MTFNNVRLRCINGLHYVYQGEVLIGILQTFKEAWELAKVTV